ncbi:MAG: OmpA family protein [Deltaproteobacteria bacterium]|nr:OmpA family protein [Deltaproteobacteria bacterium]
MIFEVIILKGVGFAFNSAELTPQSRVVLDKQVAILKENPDVRVEIAGHTDSVGSDAYNQSLSERRAKAVMEYFISEGISPNRLKAVGYGESRPIISQKAEVVGSKGF